MILNELYQKQPVAYQDVSQDNSKYKWTENRKSKLTLRQIRKLRKMLDVRNFERNENLKKVRKQYKPVAEPAAPAM